ncbi:hypothetical protein FSB73_22265 [Arachidicoccus ginsenosidivorans]|uniref:KAP NTPase domain-containing protein n=1 Tax=Arachidicoccus ginsenosidivorans TaxID=496057 RepID=A0A5B8VT98_9BACT|nr:hypothetical protein [Arachidicoccus ginsenosidivorans]QEC73986.1 hypothetical protein FSB73_22265 [Arachidicoccus ginsenosidivorans]
MDKELWINLNEEYKIKIEKGNEFESSIFSDIYNAALNNVIEIAKQSDIYQEQEDFNNIIAFTGDRGKGKSSSMNSLIDSLIYKHNIENEIFFNKQEYSYLKNKSFAEIGVIDPSLFRGDETLFEIIIAKMFQKFQNKLKDEKRESINHDEKRTLIKLFQNTFQALQTINLSRKDIYKKESIEALSELATSNNLKESFKHLVANYLKYFESNKDYLIIAIDDFDLNFGKSFFMLEDIRQFLIQPKIIIFLACQTNQLNDSISNYIAQQYDALSNLYYRQRELKIQNNIENYRSINISQNFETQNLNKSLLNKINVSASKYIEKLIPVHRNLELPELYLGRNKLHVYIGDESKLNNLKLKDTCKAIEIKTPLIENKILLEADNLSHLLAEFIYLKSNIFIDNPENKYNLIFPKTLRGLVEFLSLSKKKNFKIEFKKYILNISNYNLPNKYQEIFTLLESQNLETLNITILNCIRKIRNNLGLSSIDNILSAKNYKNVTIGDINAIFFNLSHFIDYSNRDMILFVELLKIYYSIRISDIIFNQKIEYITLFYYSEQINCFQNSSPKKEEEIILKLKI